MFSKQCDSLRLREEASFRRLGVKGSLGGCEQPAHLCRIGKSICNPASDPNRGRERSGIYTQHPGILGMKENICTS